VQTQHVVVKHIKAVQIQRVVVEPGQLHIDVQRTMALHHLEQLDQEQQKLMPRIIAQQLIQDVVQHKMVDVNHSHVQHHVRQMLHVELQHVDAKHITHVEQVAVDVKHIIAEVSVE
jgi:hypothetical protein